jgi:hypothetical protein
MREAILSMDHRAIFAFRTRRVEFRAPDASVSERLSVLLDLPILASGPPADATADCSVALAEEAGTFTLHSPHGCKHYGSLTGSIIAATQLLPFWLQPFGAGYALHGGAIAAGGKAHVFLGPGYIGKSTLALEAWLMGYDVLGDDRLLLDPQTAMLEAMPKPVKVRLGEESLPERLRTLLAPETC